MRNRKPPLLIVKLFSLYFSNYMLNRNLGSPPELAWLQSQAGTGMAIMAMLSLMMLSVMKLLGVPQYKTNFLMIAAALSCLPIYCANLVFDAKKYVLGNENSKSKPNYYLIVFEIVCILLMILIVIGL